MLTQEYFNSLFEYDEKSGLLFWKVSRSNRVKVGDVVGSHTGNGYLKCSIDGTYHKVHRIIWMMYFGELQEGLHIDHIDGNGLNNKLENLRIATPQQNQRNSRKRSILTSKYKGVNFDKARHKWKAEIRVDGKSFSIGRFDTEEEASEAYQEVAKRIFEEFYNGEK